MDALHASASGSEASVFWYLEPDAYWLELIPSEEDVIVQVFYSKHGKSADRECVASLRGPRESMLLPLVVATQETIASSFKQEHWKHLPPDVAKLDHALKLLQAMP